MFYNKLYMPFFKSLLSMLILILLITSKGFGSSSLDSLDQIIHSQQWEKLTVTEKMDLLDDAISLSQNISPANNIEYGNIKLKLHRETNAKQGQFDALKVVGNGSRGNPILAVLR